MKHNYRKLGWNILFQSSAASIVGVVTGYGILSLLADGVYHEGFELLMIRFFCIFGIEHERAARLFRTIFLENRALWVVGFFGVLFFVFFCCSVSRTIRYLEEIGAALEKAVSEPEEPVMLDGKLSEMTEQIEAVKRELQRREQEAAVSEQKKNELVAYLAHDLRTPLTSVLAYLTMLNDRRDMTAEERDKYLYITLEKALRLEELINEFFDITRFNLQDFVLEKTEMDLGLFLEQIADESYGMLSDKGMTCEVDVGEDLMIEGDPDKLARVFDNLLRNAAIYGRENSKIMIQARGGNGRTTIVFTNEGPQIPAKKLELIFERFYRADDSRSSKTGGAGLGLAIAKQIVTLHGGTISAVSDQKNTRFIVTLPAKCDTADRQAEQRRAQGRRLPGGMLFDLQGKASRKGG